MFKLTKVSNKTKKVWSYNDDSVRTKYKIPVKRAAGSGSGDPIFARIFVCLSIPLFAPNSRTKLNTIET